jgi:hypothetical protein
MDDQAEGTPVETDWDRPDEELIRNLVTSSNMLAYPLHEQREIERATRQIREELSGLQSSSSTSTTLSLLRSFH